MAVKTQIKAAVDSAEFVEFKAAFDKYETALKGLPAVWAGVEKSTAKTRTNFEATAVSVGVLGSSIASVTARGKEFYQVTTATARHWKDLALSTKATAGHILSDDRVAVEMGRRHLAHNRRRRLVGLRSISGQCSQSAVSGFRDRRRTRWTAGIHDQLPQAR